MKKYAMPVMMLAVFEAVAITLWLTKGNLFYLFNFSYQGMIEDRNTMLFFKVLYSERSINPLAAEIMLEETERMIRSTKQLFYGLAVHGKMKSEDVDTAALTFALTWTGSPPGSADRPARTKTFAQRK